MDHEVVVTGAELVCLMHNLVYHLKDCFHADVVYGFLDGFECAISNLRVPRRPDVAEAL